MSVYQRGLALKDTSCEASTEPLTLKYKTPTRALKDVPSTFVFFLIPSNIRGSPKYQIGPHYVDFKLGRNEDELRTSAECNITWLLVRHFHRGIAMPVSQQTQKVLQHHKT